MVFLLLLIHSSLLIKNACCAKNSMKLYIVPCFMLYFFIHVQLALAYLSFIKLSAEHSKAFRKVKQLQQSLSDTSVML